MGSKSPTEFSLRSLVIPDETDSRKPWRFALTIIGLLVFLAWLIYSIFLIYQSSSNPSVAITYGTFEEFDFPVLVVCWGALENFAFSSESCIPEGSCSWTSLPSNVVSNDGRYSTDTILNACKQIQFSSISDVTDYRFFSINVTSFGSDATKVATDGPYSRRRLLAHTDVTTAASAPNQFFLRFVFHRGLLTESDNVVDFSSTVWIWPGWTALWVQLTKYVDVHGNIAWDFGAIPQVFPNTTGVVPEVDTRTLQIQYQARTFRYSVFTEFPSYTWWTLISTVGSALSCTVGMVIYIIGAPEQDYTLNVLDTVRFLKDLSTRFKRRPKGEKGGVGVGAGPSTLHHHQSGPESESDSVEPRPWRTKRGKEGRSPEPTYVPVPLSAPTSGTSLQHREVTQAHSESFELPRDQVSRDERPYQSWPSGTSSSGQSEDRSTGQSETGWGSRGAESSRLASLTHSISIHLSSDSKLSRL